MSSKKITYGIGFNVDTSSLQQVRTELKNISNMSLKDFKPIVDITDVKTKFEEVKESARVLENAIEQSFNPKLGTINVDKFNQSLKASGQSVAQIEQNFTLLGTKGTIAFRNLTSEILTTKREVKETSNFIKSMATTLGNTIKWSVASSAINMVTGSIQKAWNYTQKLDTSLNDIRIVTGKSAEEMERFAKSSNKVAKSLGAATTDYTKASLIYYQQGLGEEDVSARADVTVKAANVTGQSASEVSEQLTAVWNGYRVVAEEAELYVDKLAAVAASTAADLEELSEGMSKVASAANTMGVDIDQLSAQLATIVSVTRQDASSVGTALKTIYARMGDLKVDGVDEFGTSLGDVSGQMRQMGIEVLDQEDNLRDMGEVIEEVAAKWGTWTDAQQQAAAVAIAGKRQYNNLIALFENWDMYESALTTSQGSAGTLQKQQDIYMDSFEAKLQKLATSGERVYKAFFDSDSMKDMIDMLSILVDKVGMFIESIGGGGNLLLGLGSIATRVFSDQIAGGISRTLNNLGIMKQAIIQNQAELEIQTRFQEASDEAIQKMVAIKEHELKNSKLLTAEQKEQYEFYIKQTAELYNQKNILEEEVKKAQEYYQEITSDDRKLGLGKNSSNQYMVSDKHAADNLDEVAKNIEALGDKNNVERLHVYGYNAELGLGDSEAGKTVDIERKNAGILAANAELGLDNKNISELENLQKNTELTEKQSNAIQELIENKKELSNRASDLVSDLDKLYEVGALNSEEYNQLAESIKKATKNGKGLASVENEIKNITKNKPKEIRDQAKAIREYGNELNSLEQKQEDLEKSSKNFLKSIDTTALISGVTKAVGAVGQLSTAFLSLKNIGNIWSDDTLSGGEKFLQTVTLLSTTIPTFISGWNGLKNAISDVTSALIFQNSIQELNLGLSAAKSLADKQAVVDKWALKAGVESVAITEEMSNAAIVKALILSKAKSIADKSTLVGTIAQTLANWGLNASMAPVLAITLLIIAALVALVAVIAIVVTAVKGLAAAFDSIGDNGKANFEAASEAAEEAAETFTKVKGAFDELKKSLEDHNAAQKAIDEMVAGTDEWKQAIQDANDEVLNLLDKYPQLTEYISDVDGRLVISQEGQKSLLEEQGKIVGSADSARRTANANKLIAENNMISQQGANEAFQTDKKQNWALGLGIAAQVLAPLSILANPLADGLNGVAIALNKTAERQNSIYENAANLIAEEGNYVLASYETFAKKLSETGDYTEKEISALWEVRDQLKENSAEIAANTKAMQIQEQEAADAYLSGHSDIYKSSDNQQALQKLFASQAGVESEAYEREYAELAKAKGFLWFNRGKFNKSDAQYYADEYKKIAGLTDVQNAKYDKTAVTFYDSKGNETVVSYDVMRNAIASNRANEQKLSNVEEWEGILNKIRTESGNNNRIADALTGLVAGETSADFGQLKRTDFETIRNIAQGMSEKDIVSLGYDSKDAYLAALEESINNYEETLKQIPKGMSDSVQKTFKSINLDNFSLEVQREVAKNLETAFEKGGTQGLKALKEIYANGDFSEKDLDVINKAIAEIDWQSSGALNNFVSTLQEADVEIDLTEDYWKNFVFALENSKNVVNDVINNFDKLRETMASIVEITRGLQVGDVIDDEDYQLLISQNKALEDFFILTVNGYKYLGGGQQEFKKALNNNLDINSVKRDFSGGKNQGNAIIDSFFFSNRVTGDRIKINDSNRDSVLNKVLSSDEYNNFLAASGISKDALIEARNTLNDEKTKNLAGSTTEQAAQLLGASNVEDYAAKNGLVREEAEKELQRIIDDALGQRESAQNLIDQATGAIETGLNQIITGAWDQKGIDALTQSITAQVKNYSELKKFKEDNDIDDEIYNNLARTYLAEEAKALGYSGDWGKNLGLNEIQKHLIEVRKTELDYFKKINSELDLLNVKIENAFGKEKLDLLKQQIELNRESYEFSVKDRDRKKENFNKQLNGAAYETSYFENGFDLTIANNRLAAIEDKESNEYIELKNIIDAYGEWQDSITSAAEAAAAVADSQIELYNSNLDLIQSYYDLKKSIQEFNSEFVNRSSFLFGEQSIQERLSGITAGIDINQEEFDEAFSNYKDFFYTNEDGSWVSRKDADNIYDEKTESYRYRNADGTIDYASYQEDLNAAYESTQEKYQAIIESYQELSEEYSAIQEEIVGFYEKQAGRISHINTLLRGQADLSKLVGRDIGNYFEQISARTIQNYDIAREKLGTLRTEYEKALAGGASDEQIAQLEENMAAAAETVISAGQEAISAIVEQMSEEFKQAISDVFKDATGKSYSYLSTEWELAAQLDERYVDEVNKAYEISKLNRDIQKSIDSTDSITAQNKLNQLREKELAQLREKEKLTQYDLDHANAMYELTLKQIALEEAQQTANKMKLVRDASGNYSYQYVQDDDAIAQAEADLAEAENNLYNMNKDEAKTRITEIFSLMEEGYAKIAELREQGLDDEADLVYQQYFGEGGIIDSLTASFDTIEENMGRIGESFNKSFIGTSFETLANMDFSKFGDSLKTVYETTGADLTELKTGLTELLDGDSPIIGALNDLTDVLDEDLDSDTIENLQKYSTDVLGTLELADSTLKDLAAQLKVLNEEYLQYLENNAELGKNTEALGDLTTAISALSRLLDSDSSNDTDALGILTNLLNQYRTD